MRSKSLLVALAVAAVVGMAAPAMAHVNRGPDINRELMMASARGDLWRVRYLVEQGADVNFRDEEGYTPLTWAAQHGHVPIAEYLIGRFAQVNPTDKSGYTPLMWAAQQGHVPVIESLLRRGANPWVLEKRGANALTIARWSGNERPYAVIREAMGRADGRQIGAMMGTMVPAAYAPAMPATAWPASGVPANVDPSTGWVNPASTSVPLGAAMQPAVMPAQSLESAVAPNTAQVMPAQMVEASNPGVVPVQMAMPMAAPGQVPMMTQQVVPQMAAPMPGYTLPAYAAPQVYGAPVYAPPRAVSMYEPVVVNPPIYDKYQAWPLNKDHAAMLARKSWAVSRMADESYRFRADYGSYVQATAAHLGWETMGTLNDPDMEVGKYLNAMYANLMKGRDLARARRDLGRAKNIQDARGETLFSRYIIEADKILRDAGW